MRRIGFPGGHDDRVVFFLEDKPADALWYVSWRSKYTDKQITLFGHGKPGDSDWLAIDVQFNFPNKKFSRRMGAAFVTDTETGKIFLAHRGIVTLRQRVPRDEVLEAMAADVIEVETTKGIDEYILAVALDSETLVSDISDFSNRLRSTIRVIGLEHHSSDSNDLSGEEGNKEKKSLGKSSPTLKEYFEEFSGKRRAFTPKKSFPVSHHGKIVHELQKLTAAYGKTWKSRAVDLVVESTEEALIFEVKTKADTQSVYCAIGQLAVHETSVRAFLKKPLRKLLVVPEFPMDILASIIVNQLGIEIITYSIFGGGVKFSGLKNISSM